MFCIWFCDLYGGTLDLKRGEGASVIGELELHRRGAALETCHLIALLKMLQRRHTLAHTRGHRHAEACLRAEAVVGDLLRREHQALEVDVQLSER